MMPLTQLQTVGKSVIAPVAQITAINSTALGDVDAQLYQSVSIQLFGTWVGTLVFEVSNDGVNWTGKALVSAGGGLQSSASTNGIFSADVMARYVRVRSTAWTSGTVNILAEYNAFSVSNQQATQQIGGAITAFPGANGEQAESATNLAANATYTGATRDLATSSNQRATIIRPMVMHNAGVNPGTLILQESTDGATWRETRRVPVPSDTSYRTFEFPVHMRYYRLLFTNGATAQTGFYLHTSRAQGDGGTMDSKNNLSFLLSVTALAANGQFTGPTLDLGDNHIWDMVRLRVHTDQASATDGIRIESSHDGTNWGYSTAAAITKAADARIVGTERPITERYLRLVVVNGGTAQTFLRATLALVSL